MRAFFLEAYKLNALQQRISAWFKCSLPKEPFFWSNKTRYRLPFYRPEFTKIQTKVYCYFLSHIHCVYIIIPMYIY